VTASRSRLDAIDIIAAVRDPRLIGDSDVSLAQEVLLRAIYGLPLVNAEQLAIFQRATGRKYPGRQFREVMAICGRRSGKSDKIAANCSIYEACFRRHKLSRGERAYVTVIAVSKRQAGVVKGYIEGKLESSPTLSKLIGVVRADEIELTNGITVAVWPCSFRSIRGLGIICAIADELSFWRDEETGANPSGEVLRAIRPAMATFRDARLIKISSPFAKSGVVWDDFAARFDRDDPLVWRLDSKTMNPSLDTGFLAAEEARDPESFLREYMGEFWESASALLPAEAVERCVVASRISLGPANGNSYVAALDAAFKGDAFTFSVGHRTKGNGVVIDLLMAWQGSPTKPVQLRTVLDSIAQTLKLFRLSSISGDQFCSEPVRQALAERGITFNEFVFSSGSKMEIYSTLRTLVIEKQIELLDDPATTKELKKLEAVAAPGGKLRIGAPEHGNVHDDRATVVALVSHLALAGPRSSNAGFLMVNGQVVGEGAPSWTDDRFFRTPKHHI
jgi:hypothetical protein